MKKNEKASLHEATADELQKQLVQQYQKLTGLVLTHKSKQAKNTREERTIRNRIAVIQTVLQQKEQIHE